MQNYLMGSNVRQWKEGRAYEVTFIVTEDCNLRCSYCYQVHKNNKHKMTIEVAKKAVDYLLSHPDLYDTDAVIWDFIGGEPLLEIDLIDQIVDYIKLESFKKQHKWASNYRINIGTNGTLYDNPEVRRFIKKNRGKVQIGITIDGTKRKHDLHRVYQDGRGSYDDVFKNIPLWLDEFPDATTKVTFGSEDLKYLKESIIHLWENGMSIIPANVVYEDVWKEGDDKIFENQLKELADYIIDNELWNKVNCTLFDDTIGLPNDITMTKSNYCGTGRMLAIDAQGNFYPCLRFSDFTLCKKSGIPIGNIEQGIIQDKIRPFLALSTETISNDECLECEIASGCGWCQGCNYDVADENTIFTRATFICKMHKARVRANNYYWDRLRREKGIAKNSAGNERKHLYFLMSDDSVECCNYHSNDSSNIVMSKEVTKKALRFCEENFFKPIILNSKSQEKIYDLDSLSSISRVEICKNGINLPYKNYDKYVVLKPEEVRLFEGHEIVILNIDEQSFEKLSDLVICLIAKCQRVNVNFKFHLQTAYMESYEKQLEAIAKNILEYLRDNKFKEVNILTDRLFLTGMNNCNAGVYNYTLAPNGKIYICPAFYFEDASQNIGDIENGITDLKFQEMLNLKNAPICKNCDAFQCSRCILDDKKDTGEYSIPGSLQCIKSHIERNISMHLLQILREEKIPYGADIVMETIKYVDPMEAIVDELSINPYNKKYC